MIRRWLQRMVWTPASTVALADRYRGSMLGLACGDAVGTTVEFKPRGSFPPVEDMAGGGPFHLQAGQWTDDTSMALCLAESLLAKQGFDAADQMSRYVNWWRWGYLSSTGECFDIGNTVRGALERFEMTGQPFSGSDHPRTAGNGSLMRLAPVVLYYYPDRARVDRFSVESSRTTHGAQDAVESCRVMAELLCRSLDGLEKSAIVAPVEMDIRSTAVRSVAAGSYRTKQAQDISGSGYSVAALEAALWCFERTANFETCILAAANLGDDADTTAAIAGQIAGAHYGVGCIPPTWLSRLHERTMIEGLADRLFAERAAS